MIKKEVLQVQRLFFVILSDRTLREVEGEGSRRIRILRNGSFDAPLCGLLGMTRV